MDNPKLPLLITVTGPSGTGKDAVIKMLCKKDETIQPYISCTTRAPRPGEEEGIHYYFWSRQRFEDAIQNNELIEHDKHYENYYGTAHFEIERHSALGHHVVSDINSDGVRQIRAKFPHRHIALLLLPPSKDRLLARLTQRNPELSEEGMARFRQIEADLDHLNEPGYTFVGQDMRGTRREDYDAVFINDDLEVTSFKVYSFLKEEIARRQTS